MKLPQLSLRDLFWLVLVVGMGCGWWHSQRTLSARLENVEAAYSEMQSRRHSEAMQLNAIRAKAEMLFQSEQRP